MTGYDHPIFIPVGPLVCELWHFYYFLTWRSSAILNFKVLIFGHMNVMEFLICGSHGNRVTTGPSPTLRRSPRYWSDLLWHTCAPICSDQRTSSSTSLPTGRDTPLKLHCYKFLMESTQLPSLRSTHIVTYVSDFHLMTSRELSSSFDF